LSLASGSLGGGAPKSSENLGYRPSAVIPLLIPGDGSCQLLPHRLADRSALQGHLEKDLILVHGREDRRCTLIRNGVTPQVQGEEQRVVAKDLSQPLCFVISKACLLERQML